MRSKNGQEATPGESIRQRERAPRKQKHCQPSPACFFLVVRGSSGSGARGSGEKPATLVNICNYPHPLKDGLDSTLTGVYTKWQEWALAVHTCRWIFRARGSVLHMEADKGCLVPSHHCEHARTRKAERRQSNAAIAWLLWWWRWVLEKSG